MQIDHTTAPTTAVSLSAVSSALPPLALDMIKVMGEEATSKLIREMGGRRLTVPGFPIQRESSRFQYLQEIVGPEAAQAFSERWGNIEVQVPMCNAAMRLLRNREIVFFYGEGIKVPELARKYRMSEGQVWRILKTTV